MGEHVVDRKVSGHLQGRTSSVLRDPGPWLRAAKAGRRETGRDGGLLGTQPVLRKTPKPKPTGLFCPEAH